MWLVCAWAAEPRPNSTIIPAGTILLAKTIQINATKISAAFESRGTSTTYTTVQDFSEFLNEFSGRLSQNRTRLRPNPAPLRSRQILYKFPKPSKCKIWALFGGKSKVGDLIIGRISQLHALFPKYRRREAGRRSTFVKVESCTVTHKL